MVGEIVLVPAIVFNALSALLPVLIYCVTYSK